MVARSPSLWLVPQSRHRVYIEYPPNPLTLSSQAKVVGLAQSVQYNGLRGCIAGHAKPGSSGETRVRVALHVENALPAVKVCTYARASMHLPACVHLDRVMMN